MRKIATLVLVLFGAVLVLSHRPTAAAVVPAKEQFSCKLVMSEPKDGVRNIVAQPTLATVDGQEASCLLGGEVKVDLGTPGETIPFGLETRLKVHRISAGKLRIDLYAGNGVLETTSKSEFTVRQSGTRIVREVTTGEEFTLDLDGGKRVTATILPAK